MYFSIVAFIVRSVQSVMNKLFDSIFYNTSSPACYTGINAVYREAKKRNSKITLEGVRNYLHKQYTYTLHKPIRRKFPRNKIKAVGVDTNWQCDLCELQKIAKYNDGYRYLLCCYDVFSKHAWVEPIKDKQGSTVAKAFALILKKGRRRPWWLLTDRGKEFISKPFKDLMQKKLIIHYTTLSPDVKAGNAERYIRTLKTRLWKYFTGQKTYRYLDVLQSLVGAINKSYTDTIGCRPMDVTQKNERSIRQRLYSDKEVSSRYRFEVGDRVRIAKEKSVFKKGYLPNFTEEVFTVYERIPRRPIPVYRIRDRQGEEIEGIFYPAELVQAIDPDVKKKRPIKGRR